MIAKMKIIAIVLSLVIGGSAAALAMNRGCERGDGCRTASATTYAVHLAEVEALYDHEVYVIISSGDGGPVSGVIEILPPVLPVWECWEKEDRECEEEDKRECGEEGNSEGETREECEGENESCCGGEEENDEPQEEREHGKCGEENREKERREHYREIKEGDCRKLSYSFNFDGGSGRLLLFPTSQRCLGSTAIIEIKTRGEVGITPFIVVRDTGAVIFPDSEDERGTYCRVERIYGGGRYGFEDLMDSPDMECDWDYDDVVLFVKKLPEQQCCQKENWEWESKDNRE